MKDEKKCNCSHPVNLLDEGQKERYAKWINDLPECPDSGAIGGSYTWSFTPTGLGMIIKIKRFDGYELNLTDVENW